MGGGEERRGAGQSGGPGALPRPRRAAGLTNPQSFLARAARSCPGSSPPAVLDRQGQLARKGRHSSSVACKRPGRVDHEHAAAVHAAPFGGRRAHAERGVQPVAGTGPLQPVGHLVRFDGRQHRMPDQVGAGGEALQAVLDRGGHFHVVALDFVGRVDQHQSAARRRAAGRPSALRSRRPVPP
jgi:hypothetical protein